LVKFKTTIYEHEFADIGFNMELEVKSKTPISAGLSNNKLTAYTIC